MTDFWPSFVLASLAVWRISHLLALEDGPFDLIVRLRAHLGNSGHVLDCFYCVSLWVAAPMALFVSPAGPGWWCAWPALSGAAGLLHRVSQGAEVEQTKGNDDGMLRTEASRTDETDNIDTGENARYTERPANRTNPVER
jgi:hypothetical protein